MTTLQTVRAGCLVSAIALVACLPAGGVSATPDTRDFGQRIEDRLNDNTQFWFGFGTPLTAPEGSASAATDADNTPRDTASAQQRQLLAGGLQATFVARNVAWLGDMITFWPNPTHYTHLIVCIEQDREQGAGNPAIDGENPSVQRINVATGAVETVVYGMSSCDGIRTTPWGTIVATEENGDDGRAYEIFTPLETNGHWVADRATGDVRRGIGDAQSSTRVFQRPALGSFSWEGLAILPTGVVIAGDELSPSDGDEGGAMFKFIPTTLRDPAAGRLPVADAALSPFSSGILYALQVARGSNFGQGFQRGEGRWIGPVDVNDPSVGRNSRQWARDNNATGYYRPEDLHQDPTYAGPGGRFLWTNTGNASGRFYAETLQMVDPAPESATSTPEVQTFVEGNFRFGSHDNLDVNPVTGHVYVIEDASHGDIWACLPDGTDENMLSDGCVNMLSVTDNSAEPTGFIFDGTGKVAFYFLQHGEQPASLMDLQSNPVCGDASFNCAGYTDDLVKITGFKLPKGAELYGTE